jgi:hypothetical protein
LQIAGLPFTSIAGNPNGAFHCSAATDLSVTAGHNVGGIVDSAGTRISLRVWDETGGSSALQIADVASNPSFYGSGQYTVS